MAAQCVFLQGDFASMYSSRMCSPLHAVPPKHTGTINPKTGQRYDPGNIFLNEDTGDVYAVPKTQGKYTAWLIATDQNGFAKTAGLPAVLDEMVLKRWSFEVTEVLRLGVVAEWNTQASHHNMLSQYQVGEVYEVPGPNKYFSMGMENFFTNVAGGDADTVRYVFKVVSNSNSAASGRTRKVTEDGEDGKFFVSQSGEVSIKVIRPGSYKAKLEATDRSSSVTLREWNFTALFEDTKDAKNGPRGRDCGDGKAVDRTAFDQAFTCDCTATKFTGDNCDVQTMQDNTAVYVIVAALAVLALGAAIVVLLVRYQRHQRSLMATDFLTQLQTMKEEGLVDPDQMSTERVPRELKRGWLSFIDKLGQGQFGEVWKGLLKDGDNTAIPEYMVAAKTVKEADTNDATVMNEGDLMKEALLMAQVESHRNLVSIIGVITRGRPKTLVLSFCEHGEMGGALKKRAGDGDAFTLDDKYRFCSEIAAGMVHLGEHNFIHRDLAARNVLLGSGMVCKVADFGLSRRVQTDDNTGDYYRSTNGVIPVRWTAPEGLTSQKFSSASDVWSFAITCVEIFQDGIQPYVETTSNPAVMTLVTNGELHPQPAACPDDCYAQLTRCWCFEPNERPGFKELVDFFVGMVSITPVNKSTREAPTTEFLDLYLAGSDVATFLVDELERGGALIKNDTYDSTMYTHLGKERTSLAKRESEIIGGLDNMQISAKLSDATKELHMHMSKYNEVFDLWRSENRSSEALVRLQRDVLQLTPASEAYDLVVQPNPWSTDDAKNGRTGGIHVNSKRYLSRIIAVFSGKGAEYDKYGIKNDPVEYVVAACTRAVAAFGTVVKVLKGPPKKEQRILEKARDGNYSVVRDLGRLSLIVNDVAMIPDVINILSQSHDFVLVRVKNRLDPGHNADDSAGYRDCQILVREPKHGWIVEIQIIPAQMYEVKNSCGHAGYAKYRFILEACKRAKLQFSDAGKKAVLDGSSTVANEAQLKMLSEALGLGAFTNVSQC